MKILVTGASGFIGQSLLPVLKQAGHDVIAITRQENKTVSHADQTISLDLTSLDLSSKSSFSSLPSGIDAVVHLADGLAGAFEKIETSLPDDILIKRIKPTIALSGWAQQNGVKRFVYISSLKAMCGETASSVVTENTPPAPKTNYGRAKRLAEIALEKAVIAEPIQLAILRNPIVHGPGCSSNIKRLLKLAESKWPLPFGGTLGQRSTISVANFCDAIRTVLEASGNISGTYLVADNESVSAGDMISIFRDQLGRKKRLFRVAPGVWSFARRLPVAGGLVKRFSDNLVISDSHFRRHFAWQPKVRTEESLRAMVEKS